MGPAQPELVAEQLGWIRDGAEAAGRDRSEVEVSFVATTSVNEDGRVVIDLRSPVPPTTLASESTPSTGA